jgi:hypothetical protein
MAHTDTDPTAIGRKLTIITVVSAVIFALSAYLLVS